MESSDSDCMELACRSQITNQYLAKCSSSNRSRRSTCRISNSAVSLLLYNNSSAVSIRSLSLRTLQLTMRQRAIAPINPFKNLLFICLLEFFCKDTTFLRIMQSKTSAYKLFFYEYAIFQWFRDRQYKVSNY